eukprot:52756-Alexandrium_andersonii.AAC.1
MSASLVGSEMCIRDREQEEEGCAGRGAASPSLPPYGSGENRPEQAEGRSCLLYTSDAADDM